jgi:quercetin dioxygenase-like cupin family protein
LVGPSRATVNLSALPGLFFLQLGREKVFLVDMRILISALIATFTFTVWLTTACAQDPAVVNAKTIKVRFENDKVRVLEANLPPGVKENAHSHPAYVIYVLSGGKFRNYASDGKTTEGELKTGDVLYRDPLTHAAENIGKTEMHMILVELKGAAKSAASP